LRVGGSWWWRLVMARALAGGATTGSACGGRWLGWC